MTECDQLILGLVLLTLALLASMSLNVILYIRCRPSPSKDTTTCCSPHIFDEESISQDPGHYFPTPSSSQLHQEQVDPDSYHEQLENPIYGNISANRRGSVEVCYEMMTLQQARDRAKFAERDLNYASLDLKLAKARKKKARQQGREAARDQPSVCRAIPANMLLEVNVDAQLPSRDSGTMVSQSSIYLNSQHVAQEAEDMERSRSSKGEKRRDGRSYSNGTECTQLSEVEAGQSDGSLSENNHNI